MHTPVLINKAITLRVLTLKDAQEHLDCEDEEIAKYLGESNRSDLTDVKNWISKAVLPMWENNGPKFTFAIIDNQAEIIIGHIEADIDSKADKYFQHGDANISYSLRKESRGKGYISQAINLLAKWIRVNDIADVAIINVQEENLKSKAVPERLGFKLEHRYKSDKSDNIWLRYTLPFSKLLDHDFSR